MSNINQDKGARKKISVNVGLKKARVLFMLANLSNLANFC